MDPQAWYDSLVAEVSCAERLMALTDQQQGLLIQRNFGALTDNLSAQRVAVEELFVLSRRRSEAQRQLAAQCHLPPPGKRLDIYPFLHPDQARTLEEVVAHLQRSMDSCQRAFRQNQLLLGRSIELAQQVLQRSGVVSTGRTYGAKGRERAFATANPVSRWQAVV